MNKLLSFALVPVLAAAVSGPMSQPASPHTTARDQSDREFLDQLERQNPAPPPVLEAPANQPVRPVPPVAEAPAEPVPPPRAPVPPSPSTKRVVPAKPKYSENTPRKHTDRDRTDRERKNSHPRSEYAGRVTVRIQIDEPAISGKIEKRLRSIAQIIEIGRAISEGGFRIHLDHDEEDEELGDY